MPLLLGIDLGTSYFKVGVFDEAGVLRGLGRVAVGAGQPAPDRMELPVAVFWIRLREAVSGALRQAGANPRQLGGVSYSSQANTCLLLDARDEPLTPLVFWPDRRAHPLEPELVAWGETPEHASVTGLVGVAPEQAPAKWRWFARQHADTGRATRRALTVSDYLTFALTGECAGDASTGVLSGLYALHSGNWWPEALARFETDPATLARPLLTGVTCGRTTRRATELLGLPAGIPWAVGALDHHAAAIGAGIGAVADASLSIGTVLAVLAFVSDVRPAPGCIHGPNPAGRQFYRLAYDPVGAGQLEAYQREHAADLNVESLLAQAAVGRGTHAEGIGRLLAAMADSLAALREQVARDAAPIRVIAATGGGARSAHWLQIVCDRLQVPLVTPSCAEPGCLGAAMFAATAAGLYRGVHEASGAMARRGREFVPYDGAQ